MSFSWNCSRRLKERTSIRLVYNQGTRVKMTRGALLFLPAEELKVAISISRKTGNAVVRNNQKRLVREFFRLHQHKIHPSWIMLVIYQPYDNLHHFSKEVFKTCLKAGIWVCDDF